jgi:hypothetical protein
MSYLLWTASIGIGATALVDLWALARRRLLRVPLPDYGLVGRWLAHMPRGSFVHASIGAAAPMRGERLIGWTAHYLIGIACAAILLGFAGASWLRSPALVPALVIGIVTIAAPFLLMQPGMGAGLAASRTSHPAAARVHSLITHAIFGLGLYLAGLIVSSPLAS